MKATIGERLRTARETKELDQATLADKAGVVTRTLQRWEKGEQVPDGVAITRLARATGVQASWLLTGKGRCIRLRHHGRKMSTRFREATGGG